MKIGTRLEARCNSKKISIGVFVYAVLFALCVSAHAQQPKETPRIGWLGAGSSPGQLNRTEAFRRGLRELGYVEGKNIVIEYRHAEGKYDRLPMLVAELLRLKVAVIVTGGGPATRAAKQATSTVPIVMANDPDPVADGFVASLAQPRGNITGLSTLAPEISAKQLELLKETVPRLSRVAVLWSSVRPGSSRIGKEVELAAAALKVRLQFQEVLGSEDIDTAFRAATQGHADAVLSLMAGPTITAYRTETAKLAVKSRLPVIYRSREDVEGGGLMSYGATLEDLDRRAATYVDKILKGRKPADLPVEQPTKFEFIINLKAAKQIGLTIPQIVLARADRVIK
jgi:putative ABC transport system substrate-binding protein